MSTLVGIRVTVVKTHLQEWIGALLLTLGILIAILAEHSIFGSSDWSEGLLLFVLALLVCIWAWQANARSAALPIPQIKPAEQVRPATAGRKWLVLGAAVFALVSFVFSSNNTFTAVGVEGWILSILFFLGAFWQGNLASSGKALLGRINAVRTYSFRDARVPWTLIELTAIFLVGVFFYYYHLDQVPAEMTSDHAEKILDIRDVLNGKRPIFFERNTGREPVQFYLIAGLVTIFHLPLNYLALKIITAAMGLLVVPFVFLMARELFDDTVGLIAAFFVAVSIWPVAIARVGLRFPGTPFFIAPTMFFLVRALKHQSRNDFLLAGVTLGLGLYGYNAFRVAPVLVVVMLVLWYFVGRNVTRRNLPNYVSNSALLVGGAFLAFIPLFHYSLEKPENFWYRAVSRLSESGAPVPQPLLVLLDNIWRVVQMFNFIGDQVWVNSVPNQPVVDYITGALVLLGTAYALYRFFRFREWSYVVVLVGAFVMLMPSAIVVGFPNENPSVVRTGGAIPLVMILAALPLAGWFRQLRETGTSRAAAVVPLLLLFAVVAQVNYQRYFFTYDDQYRKSAWNSTEIAAQLKEFSQSLGDVKHAYLVSFPYWVDHRNVGINMGDPTWDNRILNTQQIQDQVSDPANKLYILNPNDHDTLTLLQQLYPSGIARVYASRTPTREFVMFYVLGGANP